MVHKSTNKVNEGLDLNNVTPTIVKNCVACTIMLIKLLKILCPYLKYYNLYYKGRKAHITQLSNQWLKFVLKNTHKMLAFGCEFFS